MGTRADFYVGRGKEAEWLGSIAWDGYPSGIDEAVLRATDEQAYRDALALFFDAREDVSLPEHGWPWPWEDSRTTDYAYAFEEGKVYGACFGYSWFDASQPEPDGDEEPKEKTCIFPNLKDRANVAQPGSKRSGVMVFHIRE